MPVRAFYPSRGPGFQPSRPNRLLPFVKVQKTAYDCVEFRNFKDSFVAWVFRSDPPLHGTNFSYLRKVQSLNDSTLISLTKPRDGTTVATCDLILGAGPRPGVGGAVA